MSGVETTTGSRVDCRAVVVCCGVYLNSRIIIGECSWNGGPQGLMAANALTANLADLGFPIRRFKTGTPARLDGRTIDFSRMEPQYGDDPIVPFSFLTDPAGLKNRALCYLTYTTPETHRIILDNLDRAPMYAGAINGTGAALLPVHRGQGGALQGQGAPSHLHGAGGAEHRASGTPRACPPPCPRIFSAASTPACPGWSTREMLRLAYAIEYDCIDPQTLEPTLGAKHIRGLYTPGRSTAPPATRRPPLRASTPA